MVVRLKGGDPFVFGRGGEEALALQAAGVAFEIVPGISSAVAVPAYAGVPVTHRALATSFTVVTGHSRHAVDRETNWEALAEAGGTIVVLMGVAHRARDSPPPDHRRSAVGHSGGGRPLGHPARATNRAYPFSPTSDQPPSNLRPPSSSATWRGSTSAGTRAGRCSASG